MTERITWLVFTIGEECFALPSGSVREILNRPAIDTLPFVSEALCGVLLWQGDVYGVLDPALLLGLRGQNSSSYLLLRHDSRLCIKITDIIAVHTLNAAEVVQACGLPGEGFCCGSFEMDGRKVGVISQDDLALMGMRVLSYG